MKGLLLTFLLATIYSCDSPNNSTASESQKHDDSLYIPKKQGIESNRAFLVVDSFYEANKGDIQKNEVMRKRVCNNATQFLLPLIKSGLYDSIPFQLVTTDVIGGLNYGNFVYDQKDRFIKVQTIISDDQIKNLKQDSSYYIKFSVSRVIQNMIFTGDESTKEYPTLAADLISFKPAN
jgi:hypothetical protein